MPNNRDATPSFKGYEIQFLYFLELILGYAKEIKKITFEGREDIDIEYNDGTHEIIQVKFHSKPKSNSSSDAKKEGTCKNSGLSKVFNAFFASKKYDDIDKIIYLVINEEDMKETNKFKNDNFEDLKKILLSNLNNIKFTESNEEKIIETTENKKNKIKEYKSLPLNEFYDIISNVEKRSIEYYYLKNSDLLGRTKCNIDKAFTRFNEKLMIKKTENFKIDNYMDELFENMDKVFAYFIEKNQAKDHEKNIMFSVLYKEIICKIFNLEKVIEIDALKENIGNKYNKVYNGKIIAKEFYELLCNGEQIEDSSLTKIISSSFLEKIEIENLILISKKDRSNNLENVVVRKLCDMIVSVNDKNVEHYLINFLKRFNDKEIHVDTRKIKFIRFYKNNIEFYRHQLTANNFEYEEKKGLRVKFTKKELEKINKNKNKNKNKKKKPKHIDEFKKKVNNNSSPKKINYKDLSNDPDLQ